MQKSYKRFFSKRTKIINVQLTKNKKKNEQQIMDKNRKVKQQSFEYNNKNVRIKSNQVISKPSKTLLKQEKNLVLEVDMLTHSSKSYILMKDITFGISFHRILAKKKRRGHATKGRTLICQ